VTVEDMGSSLLKFLSVGKLWHSRRKRFYADRIVAVDIFCAM
jgi:hypothetical protein